MIPNLPPLLRVEEFAEHWGLSRPQAYEAIRRLPPGVRVNLGRRIRVNADKLVEWLEGGGSPIEQETKSTNPVRTKLSQKLARSKGKR